tara:strand:- start:564 stop:1004 length:441 start_codon:yes stop_codon:yes gene_type:complete
MKKIYLGSDHAGFQLKEKIKKWLDKKNIAYEDLGNKKFDKLDDFPDYAIKVSKKVVKMKSRGVLICGSGQGMCITANKIKGIIAAPAWDYASAQHAKEHDDANIICFGAEFVSERLAKRMVDVWLNSKFKSARKYSRRIKKIKKLE